MAGLLTLGGCSGSSSEPDVAGPESSASHTPSDISLLVTTKGPIDDATVRSTLNACGRDGVSTVEKVADGMEVYVSSGTQVAAVGTCLRQLPFTRRVIGDRQPKLKSGS